MKSNKHRLILAIEFDIYPSPTPPNSDKETTYHARVANSNTITTDDIAQNIHKRCTLTVSDIKAVLSEMHDELIYHLCNGNHVYLEGIGYFRLTLSAPSDITPTNMHQQQIGIKAVDFRADAQLKKDLKEKAEFKRTAHKKHSAQLDIHEIDALLTDYFSTNQYLTRRRFEQLCDFTSTTAARHLKRLIEEGRLKNTNTKQSPVYEPVKGYYGK